MDQLKRQHRPSVYQVREIRASEHLKLYLQFFNFLYMYVAKFGRYFQLKYSIILVLGESH